jgi:hypothetical protein
MPWFATLEKVPRSKIQNLRVMASASEVCIPDHTSRQPWANELVMLWCSCRSHVVVVLGVATSKLVTTTLAVALFPFTTTTTTTIENSH